MKHRMKVSSDGGKTFKTRWVDPNNTNPVTSDVKPGDTIFSNGVDYHVQVIDGRIWAVPMKEGCHARNP